MKSTHNSIISSLLSVLLLRSFATAAPASPPQDPSLVQFEERFVNSLPYDSAAANETTLRLVGFKRIAVPAAEAADVEAAWANPPAEWRRDEKGVLGRHEEHFWYDKAKREIRIYFPVEGALLSRGVGEGGGFLEADGLGQVEGVVERVKREVDAPEGKGRAVFGRRVTERVTGVDGNVVRDGVIYLTTPALPVRHLGGRTTIYDFGYKSLHHDHSHEKRAKKGCLDNHNGVNCSKAYGISQGRCKMNSKTCMDYNGFKTDCKKGKNEEHGFPSLSKTVKFVGSDCSVSMARGHCWNEVM